MGIVSESQNITLFISVFILDGNPISRDPYFQQAQVYENRTKIEGFINIFIEHILFTQPGFKEKL